MSRPWFYNKLPSEIELGRAMERAITPLEKKVMVLRNSAYSERCNTYRREHPEKVAAWKVGRNSGGIRPAWMALKVERDEIREAVGPSWWDGPLPKDSGAS